jgi:hypothetical protein
VISQAELVQTCFLLADIPRKLPGNQEGDKANLESSRLVKIQVKVYRISSDPFLRFISQREPYPGDHC